MKDVGYIVKVNSSSIGSAPLGPRFSWLGGGVSIAWCFEGRGELVFSFVFRPSLVLEVCAITDLSTRIRSSHTRCVVQALWEGPLLWPQKAPYKYFWRQKDNWLCIFSDHDQIPPTKKKLKGEFFGGFFEAFLNRAFFKKKVWKFQNVFEIVFLGGGAVRGGGGGI